MAVGGQSMYRCSYRWSNRCLAFCNTFVYGRDVYECIWATVRFHSKSTFVIGIVVYRISEYFCRKYRYMRYIQSLLQQKILQHQQNVWFVIPDQWYSLFLSCSDLHRVCKSDRYIIYYLRLPYTFFCVYFSVSDRVFYQSKL